ncbi:MAG: peptide deformylase [Sulfitobacter sp.]
MSVLPVLKWPDARLAETCTPVAAISPQIEGLAADLLETMYAASGRGLAASQVGAMVRLFVMDIGWKDGRSDPLVCINPMLQEVSEDSAETEEGCLSLPGISAFVRRPVQVQMVWTALSGARVVQCFDGFGATCVQHEIDHLDGVVTLDHLRSGDCARVLSNYKDAVT